MSEETKATANELEGLASAIGIAIDTAPREEVKGLVMTILKLACLAINEQERKIKELEGVREDRNNAFAAVEAWVENHRLAFTDHMNSLGELYREASGFELPTMTTTDEKRKLVLEAIKRLKAQVKPVPATHSGTAGYDDCGEVPTSPA